MFMILRKKYLIFFILVILLSVSVWLASGSYDTEDVGNDVAEADYESVGRTEMVSADADENDKYTIALNKRKNDRENIINMLNETVNNVSASQSARQSASDRITQISDYMLKEATIEDLLKAKGYEKVITYIDEKDINVTVYTEKLDETDVAKIKDIIVSQTGNNNIKIVAVR